MSSSKMPLPRYSIWQAVSACLSLSMRAIEEVRALATRPGPRGKDGFGFDDLDVTFDGERTVTMKFARGEELKEYPITFPVMLDRGVYKTETDYVRGDAVTYGGSLWIAQEATREKPEGGKGWRLAVKHGRDGKDGHMKPPLPTGSIKIGPK